MSQQPTHRQRHFLEALAEHRRRHGVMPTYRELAATMSVPVYTAFMMVTRLESAGYVRRNRGHRQIELLVELPRKPLRFPILGSIGNGRIYER